MATLLTKLFAPSPKMVGSGVLAAPIHEMKGLRGLDGNEFDPSFLKGKVVLVKNVASACGYTAGNYASFSTLRKQLGARGLEIVGVPSNDFNQEQGSAADIRATCSRYDATDVVLMEKASVNGPGRSPLFGALARATGTEDMAVTWNFETAFLVARDGVSVERYEKAYNTDALRGRIEELLG